MVRDIRPTWVICSPPCTAWNTWNFGINHKKMAVNYVTDQLGEGRLHLEFMTSIYREQSKRGRRCLHGHPASALSWRERCMDELGKNPEIFGDVFFDLFAISCFAEELGPAMMLPVLVGKQGSSQNGAAQLGIISNGNGGVGGGERVSLSSDNEGIVGAHMPIANGGGENEGHGANSVPTTTSDPVLVQLSPPIPRLELVEDETIIFSNGAAGAGSKRSPAELLRADARPPARTVPAVFSR